ncbi:MAG: hypothetical protein ACOYBP_07270 [Microbacteriaceae bacterium]
MIRNVPRLIAVGTVATMVAAAAAVGSVGVQSYLSARAQAEMSRDVTAAVVDSTSERITTLQSQAAASVTAANQAIAEADGKTLDGAAQAEVSAAEAALTTAASNLTSQVDSVHASWQQASDSFEQHLWWPPAAQAGLQTALAHLATARAAWQAEQDRIAAEKAAAEAAAKAAAARRAAASSISASGGNTAPNAPTLQVANTPVQTVTVHAVQAYLSGLMSSAFSLVWNPSLCAVNTICGTTTLSSSAPVITLDTDLRDYYTGTNAGTYVLVHEAAHARSWYRYGSTAALIAASVAITGIPDNGGRAAVERMADCATVVKVGMIIPTYTYLQSTTCTPAELAEAATYW